jgi:hypothetical protein
VRRYVAPRTGPRFLAWTALGLISSWSLIGVVNGGIDLINALVAARTFVTEPPTAGPWQVPFTLQLSLALFVLSIISLNLLLPGLVAALVYLLEAGQRRIRAALALAGLVCGGVVAVFWLRSRPLSFDGTGFVQGGGLWALLSTAVPAAVLAGAAYLLLSPRRPPA